MVLAWFATHIVVCLVPRASKLLTNQQMFLPVGGGTASMILIPIDRSIVVYPQSNLCALLSNEALAGGLFSAFGHLTSRKT